MMKLQRTIFSLALAFTPILLITSCTNAQTGGVASVVSRGPHPAWEGRAAGDAPSIKPKGDDAKTSWLSQPVPNIWLEFIGSQKEGQPPRHTSEGKEEVIKVTLPPQAQDILKSLWEEALKYDYAEAFEKARTADEGHDRRIAMISYFEKSMEELKKVEIDAPDGRRTISNKEAEDILAFARKSASLVRDTLGQ